MGLGSFGGGAGAAQFLAEHGAHVTVTDLKTETDLRTSVDALDGLGIRFVLGVHNMDDFTGADIVVVSPAVPRESEYITAARDSGAELTTEIGLFVSLCPANICGITGSNGKTTTVSMIQSILEHSGVRFSVGGNIGGSLLNKLDNIIPDDRVVLELSSFQLEWLDEMSWSPHIAAVLNIIPNHLDRHGSFGNYRDAKAAILRHQFAEDSAILIADDHGSVSMRDNVQGKLVWAGTELESDGISLENGWITQHTGDHVIRICDSSHLLVPGNHNYLNACAAAACAIELGVDIADVGDGLVAFKGLPHRLEYIGEKSGILFYNDSKATTPEAAAAAVASFDQTVIPILGGYDKGVSFSEMAGTIAGRVQWAALIGDTAGTISLELQSNGIRSDIFGTLEEAFNACIGRAVEGDVVVLTPGCASYDMFGNFEERGDVFKKLVKRM